MRHRVPIGFHTENRQYFLYIKKSRSRRDGPRQCFCIPTSSEVGRLCCGLHGRACGAAYPLRQKWVSDVVAFDQRQPVRWRHKAIASKDPLLTKWVC